ncbi:hypothetical protein PR048_024816 [Dryococelus australis]|uniref:Uncharacterized protein n=1 Tax=Dryococelus australis TaxID=614101 RepID=A0ABQ9GPK8_9NEOP|nr:hypothetical protein PR048_024816 [Dryococelus australis]
MPAGKIAVFTSAQAVKSKIVPPYKKAISSKIGKWNSSGVVLDSHQDKLGSIPDGVTPRFLHVGIVPCDATGRRVSWGISRSPALAFQRCSILTSFQPPRLNIHALAKRMLPKRHHLVNEPPVNRINSRMLRDNRGPPGEPGPACCGLRGLARSSHWSTLSITNIIKDWRLVISFPSGLGSMGDVGAHESHQENMGYSYISIPAHKGSEYCHQCEFDRKINGGVLCVGYRNETVGETGFTTCGIVQHDYLMGNLGVTPPGIKLGLRGWQPLIEEVLLIKPTAKHEVVPRHLLFSYLVAMLLPLSAFLYSALHLLAVPSCNKFQGTTWLCWYAVLHAANYLECSELLQAKLALAVYRTLLLAEVEVCTMLDKLKINNMWCEHLRRMPESRLKTLAMGYRPKRKQDVGGLRARWTPEQDEDA